MDITALSAQIFLQNHLWLDGRVQKSHDESHSNSERHALNSALVNTEPLSVTKSSGIPWVANSYCPHLINEPGLQTNPQFEAEG